MIFIYSTPARIVANTLIYTGKGFLFSLLIGTDGVNDPVVSVYDYTDATLPATRIVPSNTYDASVLGLNGVVFKYAKEFNTGLYVKIADIGTGEVIVDWRAASGMRKVKIG